MFRMIKFAAVGLVATAGVAYAAAPASVSAACSAACVAACAVLGIDCGMANC